ncbi:MAG: hypothetical protein HY319_22620 [Armatimonadetes bacterium]|nr:hypothetical protein [Armatimonadota bacterium]
MAINVLENHLYTRVSEALDAIPAGEATDVYALSFWAYPEDDDPRRQVLDFSYNTNAQAETSAEYASDAGEARWNFAYWLQNSLALIGNLEDSVGARARQSWLNSLRLNYSDEDEENDFERCNQLARKIEREFWQLCARVGRRLHDEGLVTAKFGHGLPILIHNQEYDERVLDVTRKANPDGVCAEFEAWVNSLRT